MSSTKQRLQLTGAFAVLATLALAASCRGFFPGQTLGSFTIQPSTVNVPVGGTLQMHAFGTNTDNSSAGDVTSKLNWSVTNPTTNPPVTVTTGGLATGVFFSSQQTTIQAVFQNLPPQSATANVCIANATSSTFQILPSNASVAYNGTLSGGGFTASVQVPSSGTIDITAGVVWSSSNPSLVNVTSGTNPAPLTFGSTAPTTNTTVTITANYTCNGVTLTATTNLTVTPT